jgi:hypothetical protein
MYSDPARPVNHSRFIFLDPRARDFYPDWNLAANNNVALLRTESGRNPYDKGLADLVGELSLRSDEFRTRWASHDVRQHASGTQRFDHPLGGDLELTYEALEATADVGLAIVVYAAEPRSPSYDTLERLRSWGSVPVG